MSVLSAYFDPSVNQASPVQEDLARVVSYDEDGNEFITWEPVDYSAIISSNGSVENWKLKSLIKAGIDPAFPIHTGNPTRIEGLSALDQYAAFAEDIAKYESEK